MARGDSMTIDDLAATTGVSSRSIRYYQTRGLLPPPKVRGRQGFYGERHVERLNLISELSEEGLNLQAIGWLLGGAKEVDSDELRRLKRAVLDGWVATEPVTMTQKDLSRALAGGSWSPEAAQRAIDLGLVQPVEGSDDWRILLPTVMAAGGELAGMGLEPERMLDVLADITEHATAVAKSYVAVFDEAVLAPWDARGRPDGEWQQIRESVDRIRPLAGEALLAVFRKVMAEVIAERLAATDEDAGA